MNGRSDNPPRVTASRGGKLQNPKVKFFAGLALLLVALLAWYAFRSGPEESWNGRAITARFTDVTIEKTEKDVHLVFHYALTNLTNRAYRLPPPSKGVLMASVSEPALQDADAALHEPEPGMKDVDSVVWEPALLIPPGRTVNCEFDISIDPTPYGTSLDELREHRRLIVFSGLRLSEMKEFVFLDYANRYVIALPRGWK